MSEHKLVVPKFVADHIKLCQRGRFNLYESLRMALDEESYLQDRNDHFSYQLRNWLMYYDFDDLRTDIVEGNIAKYARAYLDGYEVEVSHEGN